MGRPGYEQNVCVSGLFLLSVVLSERDTLQSFIPQCYMIKVASAIIILYSNHCSTHVGGVACELLS